MHLDSTGAGDLTSGVGEVFIHQSWALHQFTKQNQAGRAGGKTTTLAVYKTTQHPSVGVKKSGVTY